MNKVFTTSVLSGILIGIGNICYLTIGNKYIAAMLFSLGLLTIIANGLWLFTGKIGFAAEIGFEKLLITFIGNVIGVASLTFAIVITRPEMRLLFENVLSAKVSKDWWRLFVDGLICGALMFLAAKSKKKIITVFAVMMFILLGTEHSVADIAYFLFINKGIDLFKYCIILLGNIVGSLVCYYLMEGKEYDLFEYKE